jgi:hypothetical protein
VEVSLAFLASCPEGALGTPVLVRDVAVEPGERIGTSVTLKDLGDGAEYRMAAFVRDWDHRPHASWMSIGRSITFAGSVEYQATEARWRIVTDVPPQP